MTARVGVDATSWGNRRGFGRFARGAIGRLVEQDRQTTYVFFGDDGGEHEAELPARAEVRRVALERAAATAGSTRSVRDLLRLTRAVRAERLDAFLFPSLYTWFPVVGTPTIVGIHDTILEDLPDLTVSSRRERLAANLKHRVGIRRADTLFTVSEVSRRAVAARFGVSPERLHLVTEAPDEIFAPRSPLACAAGLAEVGLGADDRFFVYFGGISPHKNVETLLDAYARLRGRHGAAAPLLVLVGELEGEAYLSAVASVRERIARHGLGDAVRLPGFVSDESLACLCSAAVAVVLPSLAEGFGLPAVEAAACGAPLALSDLAAHRETLGDAALFFPPTDVAALDEQLERLHRDGGLRADLSARALRAVAHRSWDTAAAELASLIRSTLGR